MSESAPVLAAPRRLPRWSLAGLSLALAVIFAWAAQTLPWQRWTVFAATTGLLAAAHAVTALLALAGSPQRARAWRYTSWLALAYLALHTWTAVSAGAYIAALYGGLGRGVAAGLAALWGVFVLLTAPLAIWGIAATGGLPRRRAAAPGLAGALILVFTLGLWRATAAAAATPLAHPGDPTAPAADLGARLTVDLAAALQARKSPVRKDSPKIALWTRQPATCEHAIDRPTALVTYPVRDERSKTPRLRGATRCVQTDEPAALLPAIVAVIADAAAIGPMKIDVVTATQPLADALPGPTSLLLRPGLDGVCDGQRCLAPWQLVSLGLFVTHTPLPFIEDLRFGADPLLVRRALARKDETPTATTDGLVRLETISLLVDATGQVRHVPRMREVQDTLDEHNLGAAALAAERHILAAQADDGRYRYILHPFSGKVVWKGFAVPRQAGTTLALCELGSNDPAVVRSASESLAMLATLEQPAGELSGLVYSERPAKPGAPRRPASLGDTALPLIAYLTCRPRTGPEHDQLITRLGNFLLVMQRPDGGFYPRFDLDKATPTPGPDPMYAAGQAVYALALLEGLLAESPLPGLDITEVHAAVERAMTYFADDYWDHALYGFFFLEENWHCLGARAALGVHRHARYEQFCLDYVDFKRRLIMTSDVSDELRGSYGFGNVLPPHNTPTAGFGEALAAAMVIREARGEPRPEDTRLMEQVLTFLVEQQWTTTNCFACTPDHVVPGGFSESVGSPDLRIDYTQHVWSALGHGGRALGLLRSPDGA